MTQLTQEQREAIEYARQVIFQVECGDGTFVGQCAEAREGLDKILAAPSADDAGMEYRRAVMEAFHVANMANANRQGRTAEETLTHLIRRLARLANGGEDALSIAQGERTVCDRIVCIHLNRCADDDAALWKRCPYKPASVNAQPASGADDARDAERWRQVERAAVPTRPYASGNPVWQFHIRGESCASGVDAAIAQRTKET